MSLITLVRHGQASYMSDDYDKLSPLGEEQSRKLGTFWASHRLLFDQIFHGPARRHVQTMEIAGDQVKRAGLPWPDPILIADMDEFDAFQMMKSMLPLLLDRDENVRRLNETFRKNQATPEAGRMLQALFEAVAHHWSTGESAVANMETWAGFRSRILSGIRQIRQATPKSSSSAVFTSGGPIAATVGNTLDLTPAKSIEFVWMSRNASYSEFLSSADRFTLSSFNSFPHLNDRRLLTYR